MARHPVLAEQGDFLCYRGQSSGSGHNVVAHLPGVVGPALQRLGVPHRGLGLCRLLFDPRRGALERGREAIGLVLAGGQQVS